MRGDPLKGLKGFQRDTAIHVDRMLFEKGRTRFLVADEVGLGKTLVARGVVAKALRRFESDGVARVDVVYISSNAEIGRQNVRRLVPEGSDVFDRLDRLTLLPLHIKDLEAQDRLNFIAFTPGTMPDGGWRTGWSKERALIYVLLAREWNLRSGRGAVQLLMKPARDEASFRARIAEIRSLRPDLSLGKSFVRLVDQDPMGMKDLFGELARALGRGRALSHEENERRRQLVARLRLLLARACVEALQPDLVILDEFQHFRHLFDEDSESATLFRAICEYADHASRERARVLLLSATPYRMYTVADEDDNHYDDFVRTLRFLMHDDPERLEDAAHLLEEYRSRLTEGSDAAAILSARDELADVLRTVMVRTERLAVRADRCGMLDPAPRRTARLEAGDLSGFVSFEGALRDASATHDGASLQYWLSAPYLPNLMDDYKIKRRLREAALNRKSSASLARRWGSGEGLLPFEAVRKYERVEPANAKLRTLLADSVDSGQWRLLWLPPTLPYYEGGGHFRNAAGATKRLVFSSWRVAPRAIAALTSYEAERLQITAGDKSAENTPKGRERLDRRLLDFRVEKASGRRASMPSFAPMYPCLALAEIDPLELCRLRVRGGSSRSTFDEARGWARERIETLLDRLPHEEEGEIDERWYWAAPLLLDGANGLDLLSIPALDAEWRGPRESRGWHEHFALARDVASGRIDPPLGRRPDELVDVLADIALGGPGVTCLRAIGRVLGGQRSWKDAALRADAARAAWGIRVLLNHPEAIAVVRSAVRRGPYWRRVLAYCVEGGLQAVLDEFVHLAFDLRAVGRLDKSKRSTELANVIRQVASTQSVQVVPDEVVIRPRKVEFVRSTMRTRFAMRYGEIDEERTGERTPAEAMRDAFNSPFAPFVLATTSVGQEGLDFHPYCHAVVHWNLPANPVDLEQREGRVHRYKGHAVRKNVVAEVGARSLHRDNADPWTAVFAEAEQCDTGTGDADIVPYWVFPGEARIERHVPALPFSREEERLQTLQRSLALYRSVLGQPRQEELVELLADRELPAPLTYDDVRVDLSPPSRRRRKRTAGVK